MSNNIRKNLGHVTAYAYYKAGGGTMTEEEYTEYMADFGTAAETAVNAATSAEQSKDTAQTAATTATEKATAASTSEENAVAAKNAAENAQAAAESAAGYSDVRMSVDQFVFHADAEGIVRKAQTQTLEIYPYKGNQRLRNATLNGTGLDLSLVDPEHEGASIMLPFWPSTVSTWGQIEVEMSVSVGDQFEDSEITKEGTIAITAKDTSGNTYSFSKSFVIVIVRDGSDCCVYTDTGDGDIVITKASGGN